jgi:D-sedoheptulose 7-phosphate isomerase
MSGRAEAWRARAEASLREAGDVVAQVRRDGLDALMAAAAAIRDAIDGGGRVLVFGNGGSAAEAQHFAAELVGRFARERGALPAVALTTDTSILTAVANDYGFERVFARQVEALGRTGDVAIGISTSGRSPNVVRGLEAARAAGLTTIGMTGRDGGDIGALVDVHVHVPRAETARVQEAQLVQLHVLVELVEMEQVRLEEAVPGAVGPARPADR